MNAPADAQSTANFITALWGAGGGSLGGVLLTLLSLRLLGLDVRKNGSGDKEAYTLNCPMDPGLEALEHKVEQLINEQIRTNTFLEVMVNQLRRQNTDG